VIVSGAAASLRDGPASGRKPDAAVDVGEAEAYLRLFHQERPAAGSVDARLRQVRAEIAETGTYTHTAEELAYGARVAWRNSSRCIARLYWPTLELRDCRWARTAQDIVAELFAHLRLATNGGQIRSYISVFAPSTPGRPAARLWNDQLIRYAGYRHADGVVGDPHYVDFTTAVTAFGWTGTGGPFDVLPLVVETPDDGPRLFRLPADTVLEVPIDHPEYHWFTELGLRWHAVPAIANMRLEIGGVSYPLAPFNGWYMGTEIGARNLADTDRYNMLGTIAHRLGLHMSSERTLWRDRALLELNRAVLYSFERHRVRISDHHSESRRFLVHLDREQRAGRIVPADWSWIVPPISGSATPVFHRYYQTADLRPNFYLDPAAAELGRHGASGCPGGPS
jgi:nitric-oxide synthase, bacterial